jgi:uncharacterized membrane protein YdjX (TVP38/TMEM64 family)
MAKFLEKLVLISVLVLVIVVSLEMTDFGKELTLAKIQKAAFKLKEQVQNHYLITAAIFICGYMVLNVWFPAAGVLTLLGGFLYGPVMGTIFVELAAVLGALLTFEVGRYIVRGWVQKAWGKHVSSYGQALSTGSIYPG